MAAMAKRKHSGGEGGGGHETAGMMRWLVTYADMITLLLALFIMLYAISSLDIHASRRSLKSSKPFLQVAGRPVS